MLQKIKYRCQVLKKLAPLAEGIRRLFLIDCVAAVATLILSMMLPYFYSIFIVQVVLEGKLRLMAVVVCGYVLIQLAGTGLAFLRNYCHYRLNNRVTVKMKETILTKALKRKITEYQHLNPGEEKMIMDDAVVKLCDFSSVQTSDYIVNYGKMLVLLVMLFVMEWRLALILVAALPVSFLLNHLNGKKSKKNNDEIWENDRKWNEWNYDTTKAWREVRAMNMEGACEKKFLKYAEKYRKLRKIFMRHWVTRHLVIPKIKDEFFMQFLLYFLGGIFIYSGHITIGTLLVFAQYYSMLTDALQGVVQADTELQVNRTYYDRALKAFSEKLVEEKGKEENITDMEIHFRNVSFRYEDGEQEILSDFSMQIKPGERVGIVGESGKGKTTLLHLLVGILRPTKGKIFLGRNNLDELNSRALYKKIGFVLQENMLFNTTIGENLLYGREDATTDEMREACRRAYILDFIEGLPEGFDTVIGEKGIKLSGGQKQRLVLARLFLRDVELFIFDEATSALDQHSEQMVQNAIRDIGRDKTILVVAHRKSSLDLCERLIYI